MMTSKLTYLFKNLFNDMPGGGEYVHMSMVAQRNPKHQIPWSWRYRLLWVTWCGSWDPNSDPLQKQYLFLTLHLTSLVCSLDNLDSICLTLPSVLALAHSSMWCYSITHLFLYFEMRFHMFASASKVIWPITLEIILGPSLLVTVACHLWRATCPCYLPFILVFASFLVPLSWRQAFPIALSFPLPILWLHRILIM